MNIEGRLKDGLTALTPEIDYDQTAIGLPPVTSVVSHKSF
jgi:hypothetical protein